MRSKQRETMNISYHQDPVSLEMIFEIRFSPQNLISLRRAGMGGSPALSPRVGERMSETLERLLAYIKELERASRDGDRESKVPASELFDEYDNLGDFIPDMPQIAPGPDFGIIETGLQGGGAPGPDKE